MGIPGRTEIKSSARDATCYHKPKSSLPNTEAIWHGMTTKLPPPSPGPRGGNKHPTPTPEEAISNTKYIKDS